MKKEQDELLSQSQPHGGYTLTQAFMRVLKLWNRIDGRASRSEFWCGMLLLYIFAEIIAFVLGILSFIPILGYLFVFLIFVLAIACFVISFTAASRRLHDTGRPIILVAIVYGFYIFSFVILWLFGLNGLVINSVLAFVVAIISVILFIFLAQKGEEGSNKYGDDLG